MQFKQKGMTILMMLILFQPIAVFANGQDDNSGARAAAESYDEDAVTVLNDHGVKGAFPHQYELEEFESLSAEKLSFQGNPLFEGSAAARLPEEPLVLAPYKRVGHYGGTMRGLSRAPESGTSGVLSWRHVNLVSFSDDFKTIVPNIAKSWEWNDSKTRLTFHLRKGHKWSDGKPFTSEDVLFWWEDIQLNKELRSKVKDTWIFAGEPMKVKAVDECTVEFSFPVPSPGALLIFATKYVQPFQPKHFLTQFHASYNKDADANARALGYDDWKALFYVYFHDWKDTYHPLSGKKPMQVPTLESHVLVEETTEYRHFKANPYYHAVDTRGNQLPYTDEIHEVFIQDEEVANLKMVSGEVDFKAQGMRLVNYPLLKENEAEGAYRVVLAPTGTSSMVMLGLNETHKDPEMRKILTDIRFKKAMSLAINREEINEIVYMGQGVPMQITPGDPSTVDFVSEEMTSYMIDYDPAGAEDLLDQMGLEKDSSGMRLRLDGKPLTLFIQYTSQGSPASLMQLVKEYWDAVGVRTELKEVNSDLYWDFVDDNNHDVGVWIGNGNTPPALFTDPSTIPPFEGVRVGVPWETWSLRKGEAGEEPPAYIKKLYELTDLFRMEEFGSVNYNNLGREMAQIHLDHLFRIGTVGNVGTPVLISERLANVPDINFCSYDYFFAYPLRPAQWFIEE